MTRTSREWKAARLASLRSPALLAWLAPLALLTGCPSFTTMGTARTLPAGRGQLYVAPGYSVLTSFQRDSATHEPLAIGLPNVELGGRYGVTDDLELGGKVWFYGAELDGKIALVRPLHLDEAVAVSLAPGVSFMRFAAGGSGSTDATYTWIHLPLLIGLPVPGGSELTIGPRVSDMILASGGEVQNAVWVGGSLGFAWRLGAGMRVLPEVSLAWPVAGSSVRTATALDLKPRGAMMQVGLGLLFGGE